MGKDFSFLFVLNLDIGPIIEQSINMNGQEKEKVIGLLV